MIRDLFRFVTALSRALELILVMPLLSFPYWPAAVVIPLASVVCVIHRRRI